MSLSFLRSAQIKLNSTIEAFNNYNNSLVKIFCYLVIASLVVINYAYYKFMYIFGDEMIYLGYYIVGDVGGPASGMVLKQLFKFLRYYISLEKLRFVSITFGMMSAISLYYIFKVIFRLGFKTIALLISYYLISSIFIIQSHNLRPEMFIVGIFSASLLALFASAVAVSKVNKQLFILSSLIIFIVSITTHIISIINVPGYFCLLYYFIWYENDGSNKRFLNKKDIFQFLFYTVLSIVLIAIFNPYFLDFLNPEYFEQVSSTNGGKGDHSISRAFDIFKHSFNVWYKDVWPNFKVTKLLKNYYGGKHLKKYETGVLYFILVSFLLFAYYEIKNIFQKKFKASILKLVIFVSFFTILGIFVSVVVSDRYNNSYNIVLLF